MSIFGSYNALKKTELQKQKEELEEYASEKWGVVYKGKKDKKIALPSENSPKAEVELKQDNIAYLPKAGTTANIKDSSEPITVTETVYNNIQPQTAPMLMPIMQAVNILLTEYGSITPNQNKNLRALYPNWVPMDISATELYNIINRPHVEVDNEKLA